MKQLTINNLKKISYMIDETLEISRADDPDDADWERMVGVLFSENEALIVKKLINNFIKCKDGEECN